MHLRAAFDAQFLFEASHHEDQLYTFLAELDDILATGDLEVFVRNDWEECIAAEGGILNYDTDISIKENRAELWRHLGRLKMAAESEFCEGRAQTNHVLVVLPFERNTVTHQCADDAVSERFATSKSEFERFWRDLMSLYPKTSAEFQRFVPAAFGNLEFGPNGRDKWDKMGYQLAAIRGQLVEHLAYLCDAAIEDFKKARYNDAVFEKRAPVSLSRESKADADRKCPDDTGTKINCRHHTKIAEGKAGRIYFDLEDRTRVFIGKVCDHW